MKLIISHKVFWKLGTLLANSIWWARKGVWFEDSLRYILIGFFFFCIVFVGLHIQIFISSMKFEDLVKWRFYVNANSFFGINSLIFFWFFISNSFCSTVEYYFSKLCTLLLVSFISSQFSLTANLALSWSFANDKVSLFQRFPSSK